MCEVPGLCYRLGEHFGGYRQLSDKPDAMIAVDGMASRIPYIFLSASVTVTEHLQVQCMWDY